LFTLSLILFEDKYGDLMLSKMQRLCPNFKNPSDNHVPLPFYGFKNSNLKLSSSISSPYGPVLPFIIPFIEVIDAIQSLLSFKILSIFFLFSKFSF
jgi:hypothetical protein